jgi:hypothetical protein
MPKLYILLEHKKKSLELIRKRPRPTAIFFFFPELLLPIYPLQILSENVKLAEESRVERSICVGFQCVRVRSLFKFVIRIFTTNFDCVLMGLRNWTEVLDRG